MKGTIVCSTNAGIPQVDDKAPKWQTSHLKNGGINWLVTGRGANGCSIAHTSSPVRAIGGGHGSDCHSQLRRLSQTIRELLVSDAVSFITGSTNPQKYIIFTQNFIGTLVIRQKYFVLTRDLETHGNTLDLFIYSNYQGPS